MPHGRHICAKSYDMAKASMYSYTIINLPDQETDDQNPDTIPSICANIYHMIAHCKNVSGFR